jgi:DNA polymerase/3'-5' exonuclease PolX
MSHLPPPFPVGIVLNTVSGNQIGAGKQVSLEQSFVVLRLPEDGRARRLRRRVDIIFAPYQVYWTAVLGWSGSQQFERDIRWVSSV